jgi:hypothetical protein
MDGWIDGWVVDEWNSEMVAERKDEWIDDR